MFSLIALLPLCPTEQVDLEPKTWTCRGHPIHSQVSCSNYVFPLLKKKNQLISFERKSYRMVVSSSGKSKKKKTNREQTSLVAEGR
jgi:hypothetical protein